MRNLFTLLALYFLMSVSYGQISTSGLVAYYPFSGNALDASGYGNNGIVNGPVLTSDRFGNSNSAYSFDGVNDWIVISDAASLNNNNLGASFWFRAHGTSTAHQYFLYKASDKNGTNEEYASSIHYNMANNIGFSVKTGNHCAQPGIGWNHTYAVNAADYQSWHHCAIVYNGSLAQLFVDGNLISQLAITASAMDQCPGGVLLLGVKWGMSNFLDADLDDVRIYNRALNQAEILALFNETACPGSTVSGNVTYDNSPLNSPLSCARVYLKTQAGLAVDSVLTDLGGFFKFCNVAGGNYKLSLQSGKAWGGVNSADALTALKHFAHMSMLTGLRFKAGDVNFSSYINAMDALLISKRYTGAISSFAAGDWVFEEPQLFVPGSVSYVLVNVKGICAGDANGSYLPPIITSSNAGIDQLNAPGNATALSANQPSSEETGTWSVLSGTGGAFSDVHNPQAIFTGQSGKTYQLVWTITNPCNSLSSDIVLVSFGL